MNHDARVRKRVAFALLTSSKEQRAHRARLADTVGVDGRRDVLLCGDNSVIEPPAVAHADCTCIYQACINECPTSEYGVPSPRTVS
jgi:hypothetical protein